MNHFAFLLRLVLVGFATGPIAGRSGCANADFSIGEPTNVAIVINGSGDDGQERCLPYGDGHTSQHTVKIPDFSIEVCDWQGGTAGAASISIDDSYASCRDILNQNGFKGT
ncbi:MAG: hypothetical protein ACYTBX_16910, partial [Planctomycetota bacterium]